MFARQALSAILLAGFAALPASAQETGKESREPRAQEEQRDVKGLIRDLGDDSYKVRLDAERQLRALGEKAVDALKAAAEDTGDPEVQWRARRLLRQIQQGDDGGLRRRPDRPDPSDRPWGWTPNRPRTGFPDLDETFERLFRDLERDFGMDIPRRRFFQDDFFQDLQQQMEDMRERMQSGMQGGEGRSMSMQMGPDGVRVEVKTKNEDGEEETKVYEAPDLETFREKYPGVLENQGLGGFRFQFGPGGRLWDDRLLPRGFLTPPNVTPQPLAPTPPTLVAPPEGKRLGVMVREEPDVGLYVEEVQEGTLAERLGIEAGDVVVKIGETTIREVADVQDALGAIDAGETVRVEVDRDGETVVLEAEKKVSPRSGKLRVR